MKKLHPLATLLAAALVAMAPAAAQAAGDHGGHGKKDGHAASPAAADMTDGEVRKVDMEAAKVTLKHADIKSLDMPAMTMVFVVKDKAMLGSIKAGDKVRFKAISDAGKFTITDMQVVRP
jgi:Cu(I)/Ag(I) efflux system protein CusF